METVPGVRLLCLDAGNTVIFLDHARVAAWLGARGISVTLRALVDGEGRAKRLQEEGRLAGVPWEGDALPGARGWGAMIGTMIASAGAPEARLPELLAALWVEHAKRNLYSLVPDGLAPALDGLRARGGKVAVVSNSEGMLEGLFRDLGILGCFDLVADSGRLGVEKPDPRIFRYVLDGLGVAAREAVHLGDSIATDVEGARRAGIRPFLVDPHGHCEGRAEDVPRVSGVVEMVGAIAAELT